MRVSILLGDPTDPMRFIRGYQPGDVVMPVYDYDWSPESRHAPSQAHPEDVGEEDEWTEWRQRFGATPVDIAEQAFRMFNGFPVTSWEHQHSERFYAGENRSLSVGDVVMVGEVALGCDPAGWRVVDLP